MKFFEPSSQFFFAFVVKEILRDLCAILFCLCGKIGKGKGKRKRKGWHYILLSDEGVLSPILSTIRSYLHFGNGELGRIFAPRLGTSLLYSGS
jgi:hypothetical protein